LYKTYHPGEVTFFPSCPFYYLTGLKCAGCGSQRALHCLLNFNIAEAIHFNIFMVISIPYLIVASILELIKHISKKLSNIRNIVLGQIAVKSFLTLIILFWIIRNFFPANWYLQ